MDRATSAAVTVLAATHLLGRIPPAYTLPFGTWATSITRRLMPAQAARYAACHLLGRIYQLVPEARARARLSGRAASNLASTFSEPLTSIVNLEDALLLTKVLSQKR